MTFRVAIAVAAGAFTLVACANKKPPPRSVAHAAPVAAAAPAPPPAPAAPAPEWTYTSVGKRDPFRSLVVDPVSAANQLETRCTTPLGKFDVEQLRLVAVVTGLDDPVAMVEAPSGVGYALHRGACIGRNGGVVSAVRTGEVVIAEWLVRADGTRERTQTLLRLPKEPSLEIEE